MGVIVPLGHVPGTECQKASEEGIDPEGDPDTGY